MNEFSVDVKNVSKMFKLETNSFRKTSKTIKVLDNISFSVKKGEMLGIIGLNGSGKTTLLRIISGIYKPDTGSIKINGKLAPIIHIGTGFHEELKPAENITIYGMLLGLSKQEITEKIPEILQFAELEKFADSKIKHFSAGMKARLSFSTVLQINPDILLVDEILAVGDRLFREKSFNEFLKFKKNGKTILYTTHNLEKISELSDRVLLIHKGKMQKIGDPKQVIEEYEKITANKM